MTHVLTGPVWLAATHHIPFAKQSDSELGTVDNCNYAVAATIKLAGPRSATVTQRLEIGFDVVFGARNPGYEGRHKRIFAQLNECGAP